MSDASIETLGIIAGSKKLPLVVAEQARLSGVKRIVAVGFEGETSREMLDLVDEMEWLRVGQLTKLISAFQKRDVKHCVMAGQLAPSNLFNLRPDLRAMKLLLKLREKNAHTLFGGVVAELGREGIEVIPAIPWLGPLMPGQDFSIGKTLTAEQKADVQFGYGIAKEVSRLEIGQSVVVKDGTVLAVEGFEGTDACLTRGGELAGKKGGGVAVKVAKAKHDMRFDIPCVGPRTIETCLASKVAVLAVEAGRTVLLEEEEVRNLIDRGGVSLVAVGDE